jgi:D-3-phosphoglycerate dehydrogenase
MKRPEVYITSRSFGIFCPEAMNLIESIANIKRNPYERPMKKEELVKELRDSEGTIIGGDRFDSEVIKNLRNLRIIARHGVGVDNVDLRAATENGIVVVYAPHSNAEAVADMTIGLMLSLIRHIPSAHISTKSGEWASKRFVGMELYGKSVGIIGLGSIGTRVAKRLRGFNVKILYYDKYRLTPDQEKELSVNYVPFDILLKESDIITIHVPLTDQTRGMIGKKELSLMKKTAFLINTARGLIVDESALYEALKKKKIAGYATDVYTHEPPERDFPLFKLDNVIVTPHIAAYTHEAIKRMDMMIAEDTVRFFKGQRPLHITNPEVLEKVRL